ncbi:MAG: DEAD/DEAH box helicase family protein, partial [Patescibacteria group bacterium]
MIFKLTTYQDEHCQELLEDAKKLLQVEDCKKLVFKAPTGSGKTIMMAEFLTRFVEDKRHEPCSFIWTAPRQLHEQSKEKIEQYFDKTRAMECSYFEDLTDRQIDENEVLFFNWESIRQDGNIYIRDNEQDNNLSKIIERTREAGRKIILIIDESHFHAQAETSQNLISAIKPDLTIEVSATPIMQNPDKIV